MLDLSQLLRKAVLDTTDFGGVGEAPLSIEQVKQFIELMQAEQVFLPDVRTVTSSANKWQESILDFAGRIARPGTEGVRLSDADRASPGTGQVEISTSLLRGEIPVTDEVFEDNVSGQGLVQSLERTIAERFGFDIEELMVNGISGSSPDGSALLGLFDGWFEQAVDGGQVVNGSTYGQDYQSIFRDLLMALPNRFKRNLETNGRFWVPKRAEEKYRDILAERGTSLGDLMLTGKGEVRYQGILVKGAPSIFISSGNTAKFLLAHRSNLYAGYHRTMRMETWRDPREGITSFVVTARVDAKVAVPTATAIATNVDVS